MPQTPQAGPQPQFSPGVPHLLHQAVAVAASRQSEYLRLYRPLPAQEEFHRSTAPERLIRGGNRSGKTTSASVEVASAACKIPITCADGSTIPRHYPDHPMIIWVIGKDEKHIGQTLYRQLFQRDQFRTIQDENGVWHAWTPEMTRCQDCGHWLVPGVEHLNCEDEQIVNVLSMADPWSVENKSEPLIPPRLIDPNGWSWQKSSANVPEKCQLKNGNVIYFYSSTADPKMGDPCDLIWIDEDIRFPGHMAEWQARLSDRKGRLIWSALPYDKNPALSDMSDRATDQADWSTPYTVEFVLTLPDNPYIDEEEKEKRRAGWSDAEWRARGMGEWVKDLVAMYPSYDKFVHCTPSMRNDVIDQLMADTSGVPPADWTHYLVIDPGHAKPGVVLAAVPPPLDYGNAIVVYDELAETQINADEIAMKMKPKMEGRGYYAFIMDRRYGRQTPGGFGMTVRDIYTQAFEKLRIRSAISGNSFIYGSDNVEGGISQVRDALQIRPETEPNEWDRLTPKLRFVKHRTTETQKQVERYRQSINPTTHQVQDKPAPGQKDDLADCIRYLCAYEPEYIDPSEIAISISPAYRTFQNLKSMMNKNTDNSVLMGVVD